MSLLAAAPALPSLPFTDWQLGPGPGVLAGLALALYLWGAARAGARWPPRRTLAFTAGVAVVLVALQSGIDAYDDQLLSVHMVQHMLLLMVAPVLLLLGQPVLLALKALPARPARTLARGLARGAPFTRPAVCLALFSALVLISHLPAFYDATLSHPLLHELEHAAYLLAGVALWWPLLGADPVARRRLSGGLGRILYVLASMPVMALVGAYLNRAMAVVYAPYGRPAHALGISAVVDQQQAGAIMWVASGCLMTAFGIYAAMAAMAQEERRQRRLEETTERAGARALAGELPGAPR